MVRNKYPNRSAKPKKNKSPLEIALHFLGYRSRSQKEIQDKLASRGVSFEEIDKVVARLREWGFIDDAQFAKDYIESRNRTRPRSGRMLAMELRRKGIETEVEIDDLNLAKKAFEKKKNLKTWQQAARFLQSRGFSWEVIEKTLKNRYNTSDVN